MSSGNVEQSKTPEACGTEPVSVSTQTDNPGEAGSNSTYESDQIMGQGNSQQTNTSEQKESHKNVDCITGIKNDTDKSKDKHNDDLGLACLIKNKMSSEVKNKNVPLPIFKLNLVEACQNSDGYCRKKTFGKDVSKENKIIMMVGATGAGKTTLINGMINYILGVQWEDDFRFVLTDEEKQKCQTQSQTPGITAYQINFMDGFKVPYTLTIVDTPGFGDSRGISHDQKITKYMHEFFSQPGGIDHIDAVCFVVQAPLARLTPTQKYIFDSILNIFGKDVAKNILVLVTFGDTNRPPVLDAVKVSGVPCSIDQSGDPLHFKFNNSALFITNKKSEDLKSKNEEHDGLNINEMYWKMGFKSLSKFFIFLKNMKTKSLSLTWEVLDERKQLEVFVKGNQSQIRSYLTKLDEIKTKRAVLDQKKEFTEIQLYNLIKKCSERLQEIALKPNPLSISDYIDLLIQAEIQEAEPGFQDRIQSLNEIRPKK